jgi:iron complex transport system substrate-binding protein
MRRIPAVLLTLLLTVTLFAGGRTENDRSRILGAQSAETVRINHAYGTADVPVNPERVVVFTYDVLEVLDTLGLPVTAVPKSNLPPGLMKYAGDRYADAGTLFEPLYEEIYSLRPEVIFISDRQATVYDQLAEIAPVVYVTIDPKDYLGSISHNWGIIGRIFGKEAEIAERLDAVGRRVAEISAAASGVRALFIMVNDSALSAYGPGSRFGFIYDSFGFTPADPGIDVSTHGASVTFEYLAGQDPDVLFVLDRSAAIGGQGTARAVLDNRIVRSIKAFRNDRIVYVDPQAWYLAAGGIRANETIIRDLEAGLIR